MIAVQALRLRGQLPNEIGVANSSTKAVSPTTSTTVACQHMDGPTNSRTGAVGTKTVAARTTVALTCLIGRTSGLQVKRNGVVTTLVWGVTGSPASLKICCDAKFSRQGKCKILF
mmetsp:Transcript_19699/g.45867  ORF Transcript_19699/g.45867 Transcript_19699/m.45867 type:complete len:115 (-) Transcript_19699:182-526(-)